jgi:hypothetical protein
MIDSSSDTLNSFGASNWSRKQWMVVIAIAIIIWLIFICIAPGKDYTGAYTDIVIRPERLRTVVDDIWFLNSPWLALLLAPFIAIPWPVGYIVFMAVALATFVYGVYFFRGKAIPVLLSAQLAWILWWGQIEWTGVLALVLGWVALQKKSWPLTFLSLAIAAFKPQLSFIPALALWWWSGRDRWKSMTALAALVIFSLWAWGPWPVWYAQAIIRFAGDGHSDIWNASLGLVALPLFIPALLIPLNREQRLIALTATTFIVSPYLPYYTTILLLCFPLPWWAYLFAFLGYLPRVIGTRLAWNAIVLLPILVLLWLYIPIFVSWLRRYREQRST